VQPQGRHRDPLRRGLVRQRQRPAGARRGPRAQAADRRNRPV